MAEQTLQVTFLAPVPVGHRIRLRFYCPVPAAAGWADRLFPDAGAAPEHLIAIEDLQTGIQYSSAILWQSHRGTDHLASERLLYQTQPDPRYAQSHTIEAVVRGCRVLSKTGNASNHRMFTVLTFEEIGSET